MPTTEYALLGTTGLRVSPLCLGTMTFGTDWGWGTPAGNAHEILDRYLGAGGNFVDTADLYTNGSSEQILGDYFAQTGKRDQVVLATKFSFSARPGDPNAGGNSRKNILRAVDGSLKRLKTDYIDLYWLHAWDGLTPVEEVMTTLDSLVRAGKVRYLGLSDTPAWYLARAQTIAEERNLERIAAVQLQYSLVERNIEREHLPAARELGVAVLPWSPLASGFLSGKYTRATSGGAGGAGRLEAMQAQQHPAIAGLFTEKNWQIVDALTGAAKELGTTPAQLALAWVATRPGVVSTLIGATSLAQLDANLAALDLAIPAPIAAQLEAVSRPPVVFPYSFFAPEMRGMLTGGTAVTARPRWDR